MADPTDWLVDVITMSFLLVVREVARFGDRSALPIRRAAVCDRRQRARGRRSRGRRRFLKSTLGEAHRFLIMPLQNIAASVTGTAPGQ